jgi:hypothetical protein
MVARTFPSATLYVHCLSLLSVMSLVGSFGIVPRLRDEQPMYWGVRLNRIKIVLYSAEPPVRL